jgi:hypothetical protein
MYRAAALIKEPFYPELKNYLFGYLLKIKKLEEKEYPELERLAKLAAEENKPAEADIIARTAFYLYGALGVILFHEIKLKELSAKRNDNEMLEQDVCNGMTYLFFAEKLLQDDPKAKTVMAKYRPNDDYRSSDYFKAKKTELIQLHDLSSELIEYCKNTAAEMTKSCLAVVTVTAESKYHKKNQFFKT